MDARRNCRIRSKLLRQILKYPILKNILFICSANKLRSPTAEQVFSQWPNLNVTSAGLDNRADVPVSSELLEEADIIFVMEKTHRNRLSARYRKYLDAKRVICLDIPDDYAFMDPQLIKLLEVRAGRFLRPYSQN